VGCNYIIPQDIVISRLLELAVFKAWGLRNTRISYIKK